MHHALCNLIEPTFEARFIAHSYANRAGKGTHRAVNRLQEWARRYRYALRADFVQHFPSLDHAILRGKLACHIHDEEVLWLVDSILASGEGVLADEYSPVYFPGDDLLAALRPRGLPIGNLMCIGTSSTGSFSANWDAAPICATSTISYRSAMTSASCGHGSNGSSPASPRSG